MSLLAAAERVARSTPAEREAMLADLQLARAQLVHELARQKALIEVLDLLLDISDPDATPERRSKG